MDCTASRACGFDHGWQLMVMVAVVADVKLTGSVVLDGLVPSQQSSSHHRHASGFTVDGLHWCTGHVVQVIAILFLVAPNARLIVW
jgi:hypothetical protein